MRIAERVRDTLALVLNISIPADEQLERSEQPNWDSLKHVELIFALESEFDIQIKGEEMECLTSLKAITEVIEGYYAP
jgi:acyl carrier protein